ncbi:MAG TPA: segregation/condensation protein A [Firmicutes bacterium]|nr:segregation/condensation protein A [Bacillota bacterium]
MGYVIEIEAYQGPFDLLLDLIKQNEIDIWDIPIATITEQYLHYLYSLQEKNLAVTGEFLIMAATLIRIKARLLLPKEPLAEEEAEEEEDPRTLLVEQLLRYKFFKDTAALLQRRYDNAAKSYRRGQRVLPPGAMPIFTSPVGDISLDELSRIYYSLLAESEREPPVHSIVSRISMQKRLALVRLQLVGQPRLNFTKLLQSTKPEEVVVTFLAVLELVRLGEVKVVQSEFLGEIIITPETTPEMPREVQK